MAGEDLNIAYFITPHGLGHAARAAAIMAAWGKAAPGVHFECFTTVPEWFLASSGVESFCRHPVPNDIGLVQSSALAEDIPATIARLDKFIPFDPALVAELAATVRQRRCRLVLCDIAPLGLAVARQAQLASVLIENFTWDWMYEAYLDEHPALAPHIEYLRARFAEASYHIQTEPACRHTDADLHTGPVARQLRTEPGEIRRQLGLPAGAKMVMSSLGGVAAQCPFLDRLQAHDGVWFVLCGAYERRETRGRVVLLPYDSGLHHPDLIRAADAAVVKSGYSTVAELHQAGTPFLYVSRAGYRESDVMSAYIGETLNGAPITIEEYDTGAWLDRLEELLATPRNKPAATAGADEAARFLADLPELRQ